MTRNDLIDAISSCRKRLALAEVFDRVGFHGDSDRLTLEVLAVVSEISDEIGGGFRRFAIRGYTSRDEYIQNIMSGMGAGTAIGATSGAGLLSAPGAAIGAGVGGAVGAIRGPLQDAWFRNVNGRLSRSMALAQDYARGSQKLAAELQRMGDQQGAAAILQSAQVLHERVRQQFEAVRSQMSQKMGISKEQDEKWYSAWAPKIRRYYRMMRSMSENDMVRKATTYQEDEEYDPAAEAEKEFEKYRGSRPFGGGEDLIELFTGPSLQSGSRGQASVPSVIDPQNLTFYPWLASKGASLGMKAVGLPVPAALGAAEGAISNVWGPMLWGEIGGYAGGKAGSWVAGQLHGGGKQGQVRRLAGELGQIAAEIEKHLGISMNDIKGATYSALSGGFGDQFAGEYGAGYGQQAGNEQTEAYFRNKAQRA